MSSRIDDFIVRMIEVQAWVDSVPTDGGSLVNIVTGGLSRTLQASVPQLASVSVQGRTPSEYNAECTALVETIVSSRRDLLGSRIRTRKAPHRSGRLLSFQPEQSLCDAASNAESGFVLDDCSQPLPDLWVLFDPVDDVAESALISWIPDTLVASVERGILCSTEQCVRWLRDRSTPLTASLQSSGWLL
jgi:hypothetical protein